MNEWLKRLSWMRRWQSRIWGPIAPPLDEDGAHVEARGAPAPASGGKGGIRLANQLARCTSMQLTYLFLLELGLQLRE